jgi:SulP family sulfate permease
MHRLRDTNEPSPEPDSRNFLPRIPVASALRETLREGYGARDFLADLAAGAVVGIIAIPLSMALAIACNVPPQHGLYTAIVAGIVIALSGGSRFQVSGPTAAFVVILAPIVSKYGFGGLVVSTLMAGIILFALGAFRLGRLIEFVPHPVTAGFTAGIGVVIATIQLKDFFGLDVSHMPDSYGEKLAALFDAAPGWSPPETLLAVGTLALLLLVPRITSRIPAPLLVLPVSAVAAWLMNQRLGAGTVDTIASRFHYTGPNGELVAGIPHTLPPFMLPWNWPGANGEPLQLDLVMLETLFPAAFAIALLGGIESLLSAVVSDGMTGRKHDPDAELMAQGTGNIVASFFGGFAATGAIARTTANIRFGARSPIAAAIHGVTVLLAMVLFASLLGYLPMASMAALLMVVAWNMADVRHFIHVARIAPRSDIFVLLTCFALTVAFDMVVAVTAGMMLASMLFMRRMSEVSSVRLRDPESSNLPHDLPPGVLVYEIAGPLFFGAAEKAMSALREVGADVRTVIFDFSQVPAMDVTGLINLDSAVRQLSGRGVRVLFAGIQSQPRRALSRVDWSHGVTPPVICDTLHSAVEEVRSAA